MAFSVTARRRARPFTVALIVIAIAALACPNLPAVSTAPDPVHHPSSSSLGTAAAMESAVYGEAFEARAGYDGNVAASASSVVPATGSDLAVVTFYPASPTFFDPPATGTAPLTVAQIADRYGLSPAAYSSAESYFESVGLTIVRTNPDRLSVTLGGPASVLGPAFGTGLVSGRYDGREVTFPNRAPSLPSALESEVSSVVGLTSGLDQFAIPAGLPAGMTSTVSGSSPAAQPDLITPAIARFIYDLSSLYNVSGTSRFATTQGIALVLWGDGYDPSDLSAFFANDYPSSFPLPNIVPYPLDGAPAPSANAPSDPSKAPQELTLDMEWSGSMAPGATLDAVYVPDGPPSDGYSPSTADITDAFTEAVTGISGVSVVSMSFGSPENESGSLQSAWATDISTAAQEGITLLAATGDTGGDLNAGCTGGASVEFPSVSPGVLAVGGTAPTLSRSLLGQVTGIASEPAWSGSGGGYSDEIPAPSWQLVGSAAAQIAANSDRRGVPDVSAAAASNYLYYDSQSETARGTSFATPLWAGLVAEMDSVYGSRLGLVTPRLYAVGAREEAGQAGNGLADVTSGSTCIGTATTGWDPETGWGSPRALLLYEDLTATFVNLTLTAKPSPVAPAGSVTLVATLTNRTDGAPIVAVPISINLQSSSNAGPCAGVWGSAVLLTNSTGSVSFSVPIPACYLGGHGTATASVTSDGYYGASSLTVGVNLIGLFPSLAAIMSYPDSVAAFVLMMAVASAIGYALGRPNKRVGAGPPAAPPRTPTATSPAPRGSAAAVPPAPTPRASPPQSPPPAGPS